MSTDTSASPSTLASTPVGCTNFKLRQLTRRVTQHYDQHLSGSGLKITQYSLLAHVDKLGPVAPGELARRMDMGASTLTRNLQPLVAAGWLEMGEGADARSRLVHITDAGREQRRQAQRRWKAAQLALNDKLGAATVASLHELLDQGLAAFHEEDAHEN
jgi:DNA-binding MarR family transcriptional regulator